MTKMTLEDLDIMKECRCYPYCGKRALSFGKTFLWSCILVFGGAIIGLIIDFITDDKYLVFWLYWGSGIGTIAMFALVLYNRQHLVMKALKQFFRDENGVFWSVILTQGASMDGGMTSDSVTVSDVEISIAKQKIVEEELVSAREVRVGYYYVKRAKQGIKDWNWFDGGPAKVKCYNELTLVKEGNPKSKYTYLNKRGKVKKITIPNEYDGLIEATRK